MGEAGLNRKEICRSKYDTHKIKRTNRVKGKNLILKLWAGLDGSPGSKTVQEVVANEVYTVELKRKMSLTKAEE
jgi:hypothetical protein